MKLTKTVFCFILCAFLLAGCSFDISGINNAIDAVRPVNLSGTIKTETILSAEGFPVKKLDFENISFTNTEKAKIYIVPSDETKVEITYPSDMEDHGFRAFIDEGEIKISAPKQTNFSAEKFEVTIFANIEEIEISGGIELEMDAFESTKNLLTPTTKRCPHLGCALKWNPEEHTFDCPCHGSRFTENGKLIDNPATDDLAP